MVPCLSGLTANGTASGWCDNHPKEITILLQILRRMNLAKWQSTINTAIEPYHRLQRAQANRPIIDHCRIVTWVCTGPAASPRFKEITVLGRQMTTWMSLPKMLWNLSVVDSESQTVSVQDCHCITDHRGRTHSKQRERGGGGGGGGGERRGSGFWVK